MNAICQSELTVYEKNRALKCHVAVSSNSHPYFFLFFRSRFCSIFSLFVFLFDERIVSACSCPCPCVWLTVCLFTICAHLTARRDTEHHIISSTMTQTLHIKTNMRNFSRLRAPDAVAASSVSAHIRHSGCIFFSLIPQIPFFNTCLIVFILFNRGYHFLLTMPCTDVLASFFSPYEHDAWCVF